MSETNHQKDLPITVISAGAGSGKTYSLTQRMTELIGAGIRPSAILATTFTKKAAAELQERVRARLLENGQSEAANELGSALIGTVHSIGVKLLQRFAFEAGVSPLVEIIADGDEQRLFNESLAQILSNERTDRMNQLADKLGLFKKTYGEPFDWRKSIRMMTDVARANNFSGQVLEKSRQKSWESFRPFLPPVNETLDKITLYNRLISAIEQTIAALETQTIDTTKVTIAAVIALRAAETELKWKGELYWHEWIKLSKTTVGAKSRELMEGLQQTVALHLGCPDFHRDIKDYIDLVFEITTDALHEFEQYKQQRGLIDYTDMETYISRLLRVESVRETLRTELDLLLVDEFQDTSPIQLDIFLQLSQIASHSIWVGDPKQSIYGFRGAEPALMQAIIDATGGIKEENILKVSWRSRPDIVEATNAIFTKAFDQMPPEQVALKPSFTTEQEDAFWKTRDNDPFADHSALLHWHFVSQLDEAKVPGKPWMEQCIAAQIKVLIERGTPVFNKKRDQLRPIIPGDIAILCRDNDGCKRMAEALHRVGLKAGISRAGLLDTPEIKLILAYLKRLVNPNDRLSAAEIKLISGVTTLETLLRDLATAPAEQKWSALDVPPPGSDLHTRSAAEALDLLLAATDLRRTAAGLGNAVQRLDNIEVLRRYAVEYESACNRLHTASTIGGFLLWLNHLADIGKDHQGSGESPDTIHVLTYHRSKGLEYPVCICNNLEQGLREQVWGLNLVAESAPDLDNILAGRWLRFWVNPYSDQLKNTYLDEQIQQSDAFVQASRSALEEEARLLYVGLTRARDYLVFPTNNNKKGTAWLNRVFSKGNEDAATLQTDSPETPFYTAEGRVLYTHLEQIYQPVEIGAVTTQEPNFPFHAVALGKQWHHPYRVNPATEAAPMPAGTQWGDPVQFAARMPYNGEQLDAVNKALFTLIHANSPDLPRVARHQVRIRQLDIVPEQLAQQADHFSHWIARQFSPVLIRRLQPLQWVKEERLFEIQLDFVLQLANDEWVIVLLLPVSGNKFSLKNSATAMSNTLGWVQAALQDIYPSQPIRYWLVAPMEGAGIGLE